MKNIENKPNIRLVAINSQYIHTNLAVHYISASLRENGYEASIYEGNINMKTADLIAGIMAEEANVIAFSTYLFNIKTVVELATILKEQCPNVAIVFGGVEAENNLELISNCDTILIGDGESVFLEYLNNGQPKGVFSMPKQSITSDNPSPYTDEYFKHTDGKIAYFEASRGCPFKCSYCMSCKDSLRMFDIEKIKAELRKFRNKNIKVLKFVDRTANLRNSYAKTVLRTVVEESKYYNFPVHFEVAPELFDEEYFDIIATAPIGALQFEVGMQSFNEQTLAAINRKCDRSVIERNITRLIGLGNAVVHCDLIAGLPYEDLNSLKESFNTLYKIAPQEIQLGLLKVLKGSELASTITPDYVYNQQAPYDIISTPYLSATEVIAVKNTEIAINKIYNSGRFTRTIARYMGNSAYDFFADIAANVGNLTGTSLNDIYEKIRDYLTQCGNNANEVVEWLRYDYFSTNNCRKTPKALFRTHQLDIRGINRQLKQKGNLMAFESYLSQEGAFSTTPHLIVCDYSCYNIVTRNYELKYL